MSGEYLLKEASKLVINLLGKFVLAEFIQESKHDQNKRCFTRIKSIKTTKNAFWFHDCNFIT